MRRERGVALIFVLLIFAMITVMASRIISTQHFNTEKSARYLQQLQARHYALGAEHYIAVLLEQDFKNDKQAGKMLDHWHEEWAGNDITLETEDGTIDIMVLDDQGRFNLNMLVKSEQSRIKMLERLLLSQGLDVQLAYRIQDWIDDNQEPLPGGAEDATYLLLGQPYRTADIAMGSVSEVRLLQVLNQEEYEKLVPLVTVLPTEAGINMNTVSADVVRALGERISNADAKSFVDSRSKEGIAELKEVINHVSLRGKLQQQERGGTMVLNSRFFSVYTKARYRDMTYYLHSRLARGDDGKVTVIGREVGQFPRWAKTLRDSVR